MGQSVSKGTVGTIIAVVVVVLGLIAWKVFGTAGGGMSDSEKQAEFAATQKGYQQGGNAPGVAGSPGTPASLPGAPAAAPGGAPPPPGPPGPR
jgi:hypothetical protein